MQQTKNAMIQIPPYYQIATITMKSFKLLIFMLLSQSICSQFCKPYCASTCSGTTQCQVGCISPFVFNSSAASPCALNSSNQILFDSELPAETNFTALNFSSTSSLTTMSCVGTLTYFFLGPFVANNYVYKAFSGIGANHYQITVFWSFGLFGTWTGQQLSAIFTDGSGAVTQLPNQGQSCGANQTTLTGCTTANTGCFMNKNLAIMHSDDYLSVNFSSMGSAISTSSAIQAWGIKDLFIVVSSCDISCLTCSGSSATNCKTCASGLYLSGSICILSCPFYAIPTTGVCVTACPAYYYTNTYNSFCQDCPVNCSSCSNSTTCNDWSGIDLSDPVRDYLAVWIVLGAVGVILVSILLWKFCCSRKNFYDAMQEEVIDQKKVQNNPPNRNILSHSEEKIQPRWIQDIDELHRPKVIKKIKAPGHIQGIGKDLSNYQ